MQILTSKRSMALLISLTLIFILGVVPSIAREKTKIKGEMTVAYVRQESIDIGDTEGHIISLGKSEGTNFSTGKHKFMDGAQVVNMSFGDLVKGTGPHQGYLKLTEEGDAVFCNWEGKVTTKGTSLPTFKGTFSYIGGTGKFEGIQGDGTYKGKFISKMIYTVEWEGEYSIKK